MDNVWRTVPRGLEQLQDYKFRGFFLSHACTAIYKVPPLPSPDTAISFDAVREPRTYDDTSILWNDVLADNLDAGSYIRLDSVILFRWLPRSPGLYFTQSAAYSREEARKSIIRTDGERIVYDPCGKQSMIDGGIGTIRLNPIRIHGEDWVMISACGNGVAHEGFPVAIRADRNLSLLKEIRLNGLAARTVTGHLRCIPKELNQLYDDYTGVPKVYLMAEVIEAARHKRKIRDPQVTVAVSFSGQVEGKGGIYATYVTFDPTHRQGLLLAVNWIQDVYVRGMYRGKVLTDFDEYQNHFPGARFSLMKVMRLGFSPADEHFVGDHPGYVAQVIHAQEVIMSKYDIKANTIGSVGDHNQNQIVQDSSSAAVQDTDIVTLKAELAKLKTELKNRAGSGSQLKAAGEVADADEAITNGQNETALEHLKSAGRWAFDVAKEIGAHVVAKVISQSLGIPG